MLQNTARVHPFASLSYGPLDHPYHPNQILEYLDIIYSVVVGKEMFAIKARSDTVKKRLGSESRL